MSEDTRERYDPFGELAWSREHYRGAIDFASAPVALYIDFDIHAPTQEQRLLALDAARTTYLQLTSAWEADAKREAVQEIIECVYSHSNLEPTKADMDDLHRDMTLKSLRFCYVDDKATAFPMLIYLAPNCFPKYSISIQFKIDLSIDEVTLNEQ